MSATKLQTYLTCPLKYYALYELGIEEQMWPSTTIGIVTHRIMENITKDRKVPDIEGMCAKYRMYSNEVELVKKLVRDTVSNGYFTSHRDIYGCELRFKYELDNIKISGVIDRLDKIGDTVRIIDLKTGKVPYTPEELDNSCQKKIYAVAAGRMFDDVRNMEVIFWFVRNQVIQNIKITDDMISQYEKDIAGIVRKISEDDSPAPVKNKYCTICCYRKIGCPLYKGKDASR